MGQISIISIIKILSFIEHLNVEYTILRDYIQIISNSTILQGYSNIILVLQMRRIRIGTLSMSSNVMQLLRGRVTFGTDTNNFQSWCSLNQNTLSLIFSQMNKEKIQVSVQFTVKSNRLIRHLTPQVPFVINGVLSKWPVIFSCFHSLPLNRC